MNDQPKKALSKSPSDGLDGEKPSCGIVMPISATAGHDEAYWKSVLKLIHRSIGSAGFNPINVWENSSVDRISERIIGNIFSLPVVIIDISDLNANVMFELGLRLSSKKPTIVICSAGSSIPFDIRDFEVIPYPDDLNILAMEDFFIKFEKALGEKYQKSKSNNYVPFLGNVIVDVASPETREVGAYDLIISRIEDLARVVSSIDARTGSTSRPRARPSITMESGSIYVDIPLASVDAFLIMMKNIYDVDEIHEMNEFSGNREMRLDISSGSIESSRQKILEIARSLGGEEGIPF